MINDLKWKLSKPEPKKTTALDLVLGASGILLFSFVTVCAVLGVAL
jgi:hypothetical protein